MDVTVLLTVSDDRQVSAPAKVVIPSGQSSVTFELGAVNDSRIDGDRTIGVTASVVNWSSASDSVVAIDNETRDLTIELPALIWEGETAIPGEATVSLSGTLTYALTLELEASEDGILSLPATVTIPAGQTSASFTATAVDNEIADGNGSVSISVSAIGFNSDTAQMTVADDEVDIFVFASIQKTQTAGTPFEIEVEARNIDGMPIAVFDGTCDLDILGGDVGDTVEYLPKTLDSFSNGKWIGDVSISALLDDAFLMVSDGSGHVGVSNSIDIVAGPGRRFTWSKITSPKYSDLPFTATLQAVDAKGFPTDTFDGTVDIVAKAGLMGEIAVGEGTETCEFPLNAYWEDARTQVIYQSEEIGGSMVIAGLAITVTQIPIGFWRTGLSG